MSAERRGVWRSAEKQTVRRGAESKTCGEVREIEEFG